MPCSHEWPRHAAGSILANEPNYMKPIARIASVSLMAAGMAGIFCNPFGGAVYAAGPEAPRFEVDPMWPKPLPNHWLLGNTIGVAVDAQDHVWITHRQGTLERMETYAAVTPPASDCCSAAPPVLEFDQEGNLLNHWGGPGEGYDWPISMHGIAIDPDANVWVGGNGRAPAPATSGPGAPGPATAGGDAASIANAATAPYHDSMILKFTPQGKFLMQIGKAGESKGSNDVENLKGPAKMWFDAKTKEVYVADGYGNHRVVVFDYETGKYKRHWGAYGKPPTDENLGRRVAGTKDAPQFRNPVHCAVLSNDNVVYVCDRVNDRIQIFKPDGTYVTEHYYYTNTLGDGSVWDIAFSKDPQQRFLYVADGTNEKVHILDRQSMEVLTSFGDGGRQPGEFYAVHSIVTDSKGNLFTTETYRGQRVQKFVYKGLAPVTSQDQGVVWPKTAKSPLDR
jgi:DNA-binding beta-propeller fold protein YncE